MKIRTKLIGDFAIVALIGSFLGMVGLYSNNQLTNKAEEIITITEIEARILGILNSHYNWRQSLMETMKLT
ncbi:MAG: hypothetical protein FWC19_00130 [Treponema sp.]|nr:hypothetical protein [Treponema sp.]